MSIATALFAPAQTKVLEQIFGAPERAFHMNELLRITGLGSASLQREVSRLFAAGLILEERIGGVRRVQANPKSPVFEDLTGLVRKTLGVVAMLKASLAPLANVITVALVFGSIAKKTDDAVSDVDVMVVSDTLGFADVMIALESAQGRLGRALNPTVYTNREFASRRAQPDSFVNRVLAGPHNVVAGSLP